MADTIVPPTEIFSSTKKPLLTELVSCDPFFDNFLNNNSKTIINIANSKSKSFNYNEDRGTGEGGEDVVIALLCECYGFKLLDTNKTKSYDKNVINKSGKESKLEIKTDMGHLFPSVKDKKWINTENVAVEHRCRGEESAIMTTQSNLFISFLPIEGEIFIADSSKLRYETIEKLSNGDPGIRGGDKDSNTWMHLYYKEIYKNHSAIVRYIKIYESLSMVKKVRR